MTAANKYAIYYTRVR